MFQLLSKRFRGGYSNVRESVCGTLMLFISSIDVRILSAALNLQAFLLKIKICQVLVITVKQILAVQEQHCTTVCLHGFSQDISLRGLSVDLFLITWSEPETDLCFAKL